METGPVLGNGSYPHVSFRAGNLIAWIRRRKYILHRNAA